MKCSCFHNDVKFKMLLSKEKRIFKMKVRD